MKKTILIITLILLSVVSFAQNETRGNFNKGLNIAGKTYLDDDVHIDSTLSVDQDVTITGNDLIFGNAESIDNNTNGTIDINSANVTIQTGSNTDAIIAVTATSNNGEIKYMEDEDRWDFNEAILIPVVTINTTDTASGTYPIGSLFYRVADSAVYVKIRMNGVKAARWKKLTP